MKFLQQIAGWFYRRKYTQDECITRILFFKQKIKLTDRNKRVPAMKLTRPHIKNVGKHTYTAKDLVIHSPNTVIGSFCSIGPGVTLGHGEHPLNYLSTSPYLYFDALGFKTNESPSHNEFFVLPPIFIGNDVWIGDGVFVKNGITIGDGAIIGARSVVTKDIPPYAIVVGCPAKVLRYRFDEQTREELLQLKWWELEDDVIRQIPYDNISNALQFLREVRNK